MARPPAPPGHTGDQAHLPHGSVRWALARSMRIVVITHEGPPQDQYVALLAGADTAVTSEQLCSFVQADHLPDNVAEHPVWILSGPDTLTPRP
jgi:hypothetical protein